MKEKAGEGGGGRERHTCPAHVILSFSATLGAVKYFTFTSPGTVPSPRLKLAVYAPWPSCSDMKFTNARRASASFS